MITEEEWINFALQVAALPTHQGIPPEVLAAVARAMEILDEYGEAN
jgi:hypothetical protein